MDGQDELAGEALDALKATAFAARSLTEAARYQDAIPSVLASIGASARVDRAHLYSVEAEGDEFYGTLLGEWVSEGTPPVLGDPGEVRFALRKGGYARWIDFLGEGKPVFGTQEDFPSSERDDMDAQGVLSAMAVPISVSGQWWGWIGFADCTGLRRWSIAEIAMLKTAAESIGGAILRHHLQREMNKAQEQFRTLVDNLPAIVYIDVPKNDYETIYISPQVEDIVGVTPEEWASDNELWDTLVHPEDRKSESEFYGNNEIVSEYRLIRPDGELIWIREKSRTILDEDGSAEYELGVMMDITAQKQIEEAHEFQARLLESISDAAIAYDNDWVVTAWNRAAQGLYGWSSDEVMGKPLPDELRYEASDPDQNVVWDPFVEDAGGWRSHVYQHDRDGNLIPVETKGLPLRDHDGTITGYVMVNRERLGD